MKQTPRPDVAYIRVSARGTLRPPQPARLSIRCRPRESLELITRNNRLRVHQPVTQYKRARMGHPFHTSGRCREHISGPCTSTISS
jgi:hypothetical protein